MKVTDKMAEKPKIFESMPHGHDKDIFNPDCTVCKAIRAEKSIPKKDFIVKDPKGKDFLVTKITLTRGRFDDCIGWSYGSG